MTAGPSAPLRRTRAETREATHRALLDAAGHCFQEFGYPGATLDAISAQAGFTKGAIYWHFRSKEALFLELLRNGMKRNTDEADRILTELAEHPDRLDAELGRWFDAYDASNTMPLLALEMDLESRRNPSFAAVLEAVVVKQLNLVGLLFTRYFEIVGRDPPVPVDEMAKTVIALSKAVALARQTQHSATVTGANVVRLLLGMPIGESGRAQ